MAKQTRTCLDCMHCVVLVSKKAGDQGHIRCKCLMWSYDGTARESTYSLKSFLTKWNGVSGQMPFKVMLMGDECDEFEIYNKERENEPSIFSR